jgi:hypothetical protein
MDNFRPVGCDVGDDHGLAGRTRMGTRTVKKPRMRVTLYLPDELREQANAAGLNLSRLLREAVERELHGDAPGIRSSGRRVQQSVELTVTVPLETIRGLLDDPKA